MTPYDRTIATPGTRVAEPADARALFGQTMGLVAVATGFAALGAYLGRDMSGGTGLLFLLAALGCVIGLNVAVRRSEQLAIALLFGLGLLLGIAIGPIIHVYMQSEPGVVYQAAGATALFVGALGTYGYATKRDLSAWARPLFWMLLGLIGFGLIALLVAIPGGNTIYALAGLAIFGAFTIFDFNRLRRTGDMALAPAIAASIFLDVFNIFLFFLQILGGGGGRR